MTGSDFSRKEIVDVAGIDPEKVIAVPNGVDARFSPSEPDLEWLARRFRIHGPFVLTVGTLEPRKNLVTAIRAVQLLAANGVSLTLVMAGDRGWRNDELDGLIASSVCPTLATGYLQDDGLVRLYGSARCFVYPSLYEGFGLPPLEAMACGTPVISSNRASLPEVVGGAALLVAPDDVQAIADAIFRVTTDDQLAVDLGRRGLERSSKFTWQRCAKETVAVYEEALAAAC